MKDDAKPTRAQLIEQIDLLQCALLEERASGAHLIHKLQENRRLTRRMFAVQEKERRHLSRELHDELGQWLTAIQAEAQTINTMACTKKENSHCQDSTQSIINSTTQVHQVLRRILRRLRPSMLDQLGLADSLREMVGQWRRHHPDIACDLVLDDALEGLDETLNITLYRAVQEALTNISSHADAGRVTISVRRAPDTVLLSVEDNGRGMDMHLPRQGLGLLGMRERVIAAEGEFVLHSMPGQGLRIDIGLPLITRSEEENESSGRQNQ